MQGSHSGLVEITNSILSEDFELWDFQMLSTTQLLVFNLCIELSSYKTEAYSLKLICCDFWVRGVFNLKKNIFFWI